MTNGSVKGRRAWWALTLASALAACADGGTAASGGGDDDGGVGPVRDASTPGDDARPGDGGGGPDAARGDASPPDGGARDGGGGPDAARGDASPPDGGARDGAIDPDQGADCEDGQTRPCPGEEAACPGSVQTCAGGAFGPCAAPAEECNGLDDDCDGSTDEEFLGLGEPCTRGEGACAAQGTTACDQSGTRTVCDAELPAGCCAGDEDCAADERCVDSACVAEPACVEDADCAAGERCVAGACEDAPACVEDADCAAGERCVAGACEGAPACVEDADCAAGEVCVAGVCEPVGCLDDADCAAGEVCVAGACEGAPACVEDADCDAGEVCVAGACEPVGCLDDAFEDNDAAGGAAPLGTGARDDLQVCADDEDWFAIDVCAGGTLTVALAFEHDDGDLDVELLDAAGDTLDTSNSSQDGEQVSYAPAGPETVLLRVYGFRGAHNAYAIDVDVDGCVAPCAEDLDCAAGEVCVDGACVVDVPACEDDAFEDNDDAGSATPLEAGSIDDLRICAGDVDGFRVALCAGGTLTVDVRFTHADGDLDAALLDARGGELATSEGTDDGEHLAHTAVAAEEVFVVVYGFGGAGTTYGLDVAIEGCVDEPVCVEDDHEADDTPATATPVGGDALFEDRVLCPADEDWYAVRACAGGTLRVTAAFAHADGDIDLQVFDAEGNALGTSDSLEDVEALEIPVEGEAELFVRVYGFGDLGNTYSLAIEVADCGCEVDGDCPAGQACVEGACVAPEPCVDDGLEDNDAAGAATPAEPGDVAGLQVCAGDDDWYVVDVCAGGTLSVGLAFTHADGDLDLALHGDDGAVLARSQGVGDEERVELAAQSARRLWVRVYGFRGAEGAYDLGVVVDGCDAGPVCVDDLGEDNDTIDAALPVLPGAAAGLAICAGDEDWYAVDVCAGGVLTTTVRFEHDLGDVDVQLVDAEGAVLMTSASTSDEERLRHQAEGAGTVLVRVYGFGGAENAYDLEIALDGCGCAEDADCPAGQICADGACVAPPACVDDAFEDNDLLETAADLVPGAYPGLQVCSGDLDLFAVDVCAGGTLAVDVTFTHADGDVDAALLAADGTVLVRSATVADAERLERASDADERVYLAVYGFGGAVNAYDLNVTVEGCEGPVCVDDDLEENDALENAAAVPAGVYRGRAICSADDDWYAVDVCAGGVLTVRTRFTHADGDLDLSIHDADGTRVDISQGVGDEEALRVSAEAAATAYVRVYGYQGAQNDYDLEITLDGCGCVDDRDCPAGQVCAEGACVDRPVCEDDALEENDDPAAARALAPGAYAGLQVCAGDLDWYGVEVCAGGTVTVDVAFTHAAGDVDAVLFGGDGTPLVRAETADDGERLVYASAAAQRLSLAVYGFGGAENAYALNVAVDGCDADFCADDALEDNDGPDTATPIVPGRGDGLAVCAGDQDWYAVDVCAGGVLTVRTRFRHADGDVDLALVDAAGEELAASRGVGDVEEARYAAPAAGTVNIAVFGYQDAENTYALEVELAGCGCETDDDCPAGQRCAEGACVAAPVCQDDAAEDNDALEAAIPAAPGAYGGLAVCADDEDWYAVAVCAGGAVAVDVTFAHAGGDLDVELLDAGGDVLDTSDSSDDDERVEHAAEADAVVFVRVYGFAGAENAYGLNVAVDGCAPVACEDDGAEDNDTLETAAEAAPGLAEGLAVCAGDDDWFAVEVCAGGVLTARAIFAHATGDLDLALHDAAGAELARSAGVGDLEEARARAAVDGPLYVRVHGFRDAENTYALELQVEGCGCESDDDCLAGDVCAEGRCVAAPDGTCEAPFFIGAFGAIEGTTADRDGVHGGTCGGGAQSGEAVYAMAFDVGGEICLNLAGSAYDTVLYVRAADCARREAEAACNDDDDAAGGLRSALTLSVEPGIVYFVFVDGFSPADGGVREGDYVLDVTPGPCAVGCAGDEDCGEGEICVEGACVAAPACAADEDCGEGELCVEGECEPAPVACVPDANEEDDALDAARPLEVNRRFVGLNFCDDGADWFRFNAGGQTRYDVQTFNLSAGADTLLTLFDANGVQLASNDDGGDDGLASLIANWQPPAAGIYYVRVSSFLGATGDLSYSVGVRSTCQDDEFEHDDEPADARPFEVGGAPQARRHCQDEDWVRFDAVAGETYVIETRDLAGSDDSTLTLLDVDGATALDFNDDRAPGDASSLIEWVAPADGTYFVRAGTFNDRYGASRRYTLAINRAE